jgi:hypothetical protein
MNTNRWMGFVAISVLLLGLLAVLVPTSPGQAPTAKPGVIWEYKLHFAGNEDHLEPLNKLGLEGWEMVTAYNTDSQRPVVYVFKRAKH